MQKNFCDVCEQEITEKNQLSDQKGNGTITAFTQISGGKRFIFEVIVKLDGRIDKENICRHCVLSALNNQNK